MARFRRLYKQSPTHLLGFAAMLAVAGFALREFFDSDAPDKVFLWFFGAIVAHDLVLLPLYSLVDRVLSRRPASAPGPAPYALERMHLRVPSVLSGLLLLVFFPLILRASRRAYGEASSLSPDPYLHRWLIATAALFALSGAVYSIRAIRARRP
jgi:hypothetical protein